MAAKRGMPLSDVAVEAVYSMQESPEKGPERRWQRQQQEVKQPQQHQPRRLHHLDWFRLLMALAVVYAHTSKSGLTTGGGFNEIWLIDDRTLFDHEDFAKLYSRLMEDSHTGPVSGQCVPAHHSRASRPPHIVGPSPLAVRWISIARQWTLPLLFWISGAAVACSYRGGAPRGLLKLAGFTAVGMSFNAVLWFLGPMDDTCFIGNPECDDKGLVFSFTVVPFAGMVFAILFQMWYTVMLAGFCIVNWPLFTVAYGSTPRLWVLFLEWFIMMAIYSIFLFMADECAVPRLVISLLAVLEVAFLALVALVSPNLEGCERPRWVPVRALHYLMAIVTVVQFGALPFAHQMDSIGATYILYMVVGFNRFFNMGFIMTSSQLSDDGRKAEPLFSRAWPLALILFVLVAPSTNWDLAGMLTYPFFLHMCDRMLYVAGAVCVVFLLDRCSRSMHCEPLPGFLSQTALVLYLFHPCLITVCLHFGMRTVSLVWLASVAVAVAIAALLEWAPAALSRDAAEGASSEEEEEEDDDDDE